MDQQYGAQRKPFFAKYHFKHGWLDGFRKFNEWTEVTARHHPKGYSKSNNVVMVGGPYLGRIGMYYTAPSYSSIATHIYTGKETECNEDCSCDLATVTNMATHVDYFSFKKNIPSANLPKKSKPTTPSKSKTQQQNMNSFMTDLQGDVAKQIQLLQQRRIQNHNQLPPLNAMSNEIFNGAQMAQNLRKQQNVNSNVNGHYNRNMNDNKNTSNNIQSIPMRQNKINTNCRVNLNMNGNNNIMATNNSMQNNGNTMNMHPNFNTNSNNHRYNVKPPTITNITSIDISNDTNHNQNSLPSTNTNSHSTDCRPRKKKHPHFSNNAAPPPSTQHNQLDVQSQASSMAHPSPAGMSKNDMRHKCDGMFPKKGGPKYLCPCGPKCGYRKNYQAGLKKMHGKALTFIKQESKQISVRISKILKESGRKDQEINTLRHQLQAANNTMAQQQNQIQQLQSQQQQLQLQSQQYQNQTQHLQTQLQLLMNARETASTLGMDQSNNDNSNVLNHGSHTDIDEMEGNVDEYGRSYNNIQSEEDDQKNDEQEEIEYGDVDPSLLKFERDADLDSYMSQMSQVRVLGDTSDLNED